MFPNSSIEETVKQGMEMMERKLHSGEWINEYLSTLTVREMIEAATLTWNHAVKFSDDRLSELNREKENKKDL